MQDYMIISVRAVGHFLPPKSEKSKSHLLQVNLEQLQADIT